MTPLALAGIIVTSIRGNRPVQTRSFPDPGSQAGDDRDSGRIRSSRIAEIDIVRGACVMAMLAFHVLILGFPGSDDLHTVNIVMNSLAVIRMPVLMFVSGVLASSMLIASREDILLRAFKLIWLFIVWTLPIYFAASYIYGSPVRIDAIITELIDSSTPLWFIWALCVYTLSLIWLRPQDRNIVLILTVILGGLSWAGQSYGWTNMMYGNTVRLAAMFYGGVYLAPFIRRRLRAPLNVRVTIAAVLAIILMPLADWLIRFWGLDVLGSVERLPIGYAALLAATAFRFFPKLSALFQWLGRNTLPIYLGHIPILALVLHVKAALPAGDWMRYPLVVGMTVTGTLLVKDILYLCGTGWLYEMPARLGPGGAMKRYDARNNKVYE